MTTAFLNAQWKNLLMANYEIDPKHLKKLLPYKTELDEWNGIHYLSLVGFLFKETKVKGVIIPFHKDFEEVNLRFYVRSKEEGKWRRGVVFIREIVPKRLISFVANTFYNEKYTTFPMKHYLDFSDPEKINIQYEWKVKSEWNFIKAIALKDSEKIVDRSEEEFITEHYWGYTQLTDKITSEYEVVHPKWQIHKVTDYEVKCNAKNLYGKEFIEVLEQKPKSVFLADGSEISVMKKRIML